MPGPFLNIKRFTRAAYIRQLAAVGAAQFTFAGLFGAGLGVSAGGVPILKAATVNDNVTAAGAVSVNTLGTRLNTSSGSDVAITLADGIENQIKVIVMETKGSTGNFVLTPANLWGYTTLTFNTVGDAAILMFINGKWAIVANQGTTLG